MSDRDLDAEFARIIAGWDEEAPDPQPRAPRQAETEVAGPDQGDATDPHPAGDEGDADQQPPTASAVPETSGAPGAPSAPSAPGAPAAPGSPTSAAPSAQLGLPIAPTTSHSWRGSTARDGVDGTDGALDAADAVDDDEHFVPPSEIDLPSAETDPMFWAIVGGLVGGPLLLLYLLFFDRDGSGWWIATALAMVVVGFVLLVLRGGTERDPFDDGTRL